MIILLLCLFLNKTYSQSSNREFDGFSINPKYGLYKAVGEKEGFSGGAEINLIKNKFLYSVDYYRFEELGFFKSPVEHFNQLAIMLGKYNENGIFRMQYQTGLALLWGLKRTDIIASNL